MNESGELSFPNQISDFLHKLTFLQEDDIDSVKELFQKYPGIQWSDNDIRLLLKETNISWKKKFYVLILANHGMEPSMGFYTLLEYLFQKSFLIDDPVDNPKVTLGWIKRNKKKIRGNMSQDAFRSQELLDLQHYGINENWYLREQVGKSVEVLVAGSADELIILACRFINLGKLEYSLVGCRAIYRLALMGRENCEKYLNKYLEGGFEGAKRVHFILELIWNSEPVLEDLQLGQVISQYLMNNGDN